VPTDPFVANEIDETPRHRQNLPPGVAYPPARRVSTDRPGDLPRGQPSGPLLGVPGPNVGYARTLAERARVGLRLAAGEHDDDAVAVVAEIAMKRAALFGRAPVKPDVDLAIALLGYDGSAAGFEASRARLVHDAAHHYQARRRLVDAVPAELLRHDVASAAAHAGAWREQVTQALTHH
jgi:hypothetical protein